jgi:hypothetical protein
MNANLVSIDICDEKSLLNACDILHDARFDLGSAKFDAQVATWNAIFIREFFEDATLVTERRGIVFTSFTYPMAESVLELDGVADYSVRDRSHIARHTFSECQVRRGKCRLFFCEGMEIVLTFKERPSGCLRDVRLLEEHGARRVLRNPFRRK